PRRAANGQGLRVPAGAAARTGPERAGGKPASLRRRYWAVRGFHYTEPCRRGSGLPGGGAHAPAGAQPPHAAEEAAGAAVSGGPSGSAGGLAGARDLNTHRTPTGRHAVG